jgi:protein involved in temperature-dependent protein secretion
MLRPTANYKMSKPTKTGLALHKFKDAHARGAWKRAMIQAELSAAIQPKREKGKREE